MLLLVSLVVLPGPLLARPTYQANPGTEVNRSLAQFSRAERSGDVNMLYDLMLPEARMLMTREAFANWWPTVAPAAPQSALRVESLDFSDGTYDLTGTAIKDIAHVQYSYRDANDNRVDRTMNLAQVGGVWRWMPDITQADLATINSFATANPQYTSQFKDEFFADLDTYWGNVFADWGIPYHPPADIVAVTRPGYNAGCRVIYDLSTLFAEYCTLNEVIYYNPAMMDTIVSRFGQSGWDMVVAHEWGHHVQNTSGARVTKFPELFGGNYSIEHELQADCLSATFMQDYTVRGAYTPRAIDNLRNMIEYFGDPNGTPWAELGAHGTNSQRIQSFYTGIQDGLRGCHIGGN